MGKPFGAFGFKVLIDDIENPVSYFQEVSGLGVSIAVSDRAEGGLNTTTHKMLGGTSYSDVTFKRGLSGTGLFRWIQSVLMDAGEKKRERKDIKVLILGDSKGEVVGKITLLNAIPVKWDGPSLSVTQDSIATETLVVAHEGLVFEA